MMPAGKYYVGDLCYVMHDEWDEVCHLMFQGRTDNGCNDGEFRLRDGRKFASYGTKFGDGEYNDQLGNRYGVDAGLIGCIRLEDIDLKGGDNFITGGAIVEFASAFYTSGGRDGLGRDWDGVIKIGHLQIETDPMEVTEW
jgi:hypothetical protein